MTVNIILKTKEKLPVSDRKIEQILNIAAKELKIKNSAELSILIAGDQKIKKLNKQYRNKDKVTDVLAFSQIEGEDLVLPQEQENYLGEIIICFPQIKRQAKKINQLVKDELILLIIHGFLHLLGYDDQKDKDYQKMKKIEDKLLKKIYAEI